MIVQLMGGLGNQMFQYAFGISVAYARNLPVEFRGKKTNSETHIQYMLDVYDLDIKWANSRAEQPKMYQERGMPFDSGVYAAPQDVYYFGNWQTERYFQKELVTKAFMHPKGLASAQNRAWGYAVAEDGAFIQVRRGDYLNPTTKAYHGCQTLDYYMEGAKIINLRNPDTKFFVFSDDPQWCRENFPPEFTVVSHNTWQDRTAQWDLWLMSMCPRGGVMANSSFGWWGAWLGDQRFSERRPIVAPAKWFDEAPVDVRDIVPERWVKI